MLIFVGEVVKKNTTYKANDVLDLCREEISAVSKDLWTGCCEHVQKLESLLMEQENLSDEFIYDRLAENRIVIPLGDDTDVDSEDEELNYTVNTNMFRKIQPLLGTEFSTDDYVMQDHKNICEDGDNAREMQVESDSEPDIDEESIDGDAETEVESE